MHPARWDAKFYESELARMQVELSKLQEWVIDHGKKVVVIFEGRDAAGKGGTISRITARLNPRRLSGGRPGQTDGPRADPVVFSAVRDSPARGGRDRSIRPELVQPGRRRAGDGILHGGGIPGVPAYVPAVRAHARAVRYQADQVLVLGGRRGTGAPLQ